MVSVSKKDLFFSHGGTALMSTICLVMYECPAEAEDTPVIPCLDKKVLIVYRNLKDRFLSGWLSVCLLVCGMVHNQGSLQSWGEAWLLAWQYWHLTATVDEAWAFSHCYCVKGKPRAQRSLQLWSISVHKEPIAPSGNQVQSSVGLLQQNYYCTVIKLLKLCL